MTTIADRSALDAQGANYARIAVREAEEAFYRTLAAHFPGVKTGDMAPGDAEDFSTACDRAAMVWLSMNANLGLRRDYL